jgi:hypothetical protein
MRAEVAVRAATVTVAAAATTTQLVDFGVYANRVRLLDMLTHRSLFGVVSLAVVALAAGACALLALGARDRRRPALLAVLLGALLVLRIAQPSHVLLLALPLNAAALLLLWNAPLPPAARRVLRDGCVVLVLAFAVHGVGEKIVAELGYGPDTWAYQIKAVVKHSGELAGWTLVAGGLLLGLVSPFGRARVAAGPAGRPRGAEVVGRRAAFRRRDEVVGGRRVG